MDTQIALLITSVSMNILLIVKDFVKRIKRSDCCGSHLDLSTDKPPQNEPPVSV